MVLEDTDHIRKVMLLASMGLIFIRSQRSNSSAD